MAESNLETPIRDQTLLNQTYDPVLLAQQQSRQIHELQGMVQNLLSRQVALTNTTPARPSLRKEHFDLIPQFDGSPERLHYFLEVTQRLHDQFYNEQYPDAFENFTLISGIKSKIVPPAANHVLSSNIDTFPQVKSALLNAYCDKRDDLTLAIELVNLRQRDGENAFTYHDKILKTSNLIVAYLQNHRVENAEILIENYQRLALRCFLLHLREPLGSLLRTRQPNDLATALSWLTNDYQHLQQHPRNANNNQSRNFPQKNNPVVNPSHQKSQPSQLNRTYVPGNSTFSRPQYQQPNKPQNANASNRNVSNTFNSKPISTPPANPAGPNFVPRATSTMKPTPMSWRTSNTNFHNIEGTGEISDNPNPTPEMEDGVEEQPDTQNDDQPQQYEENPFLEETSLEYSMTN